jgi:pSer/pThr/pTyr-binding forkhead associated (FHA) protein
MKVFISYARQDDAVVQSLAADLVQARQQVWLDRDLAGGDAWWPEILAQIRSSTVFVFALSDNSLRSKPCRSELAYAEALGLPILPVQVGRVSTRRTDPIFTKQLVEYQDSTRHSGIALVSAVFERGLQRTELPDPLPEPPAIPYEHLLRLGAAIHGTAKLTHDAQASIVAELREALRSEDDHDVAQEIRELLRTLRERKEVTDSVAREIDSALDNPAQPVATDEVGHSVGPQTTSDESHHVGRTGGIIDQAAAAYLDSASGRRYPLQAVATRIGRLRDNDIVLDDVDVSPHHAVIIETGTGYSFNSRANYIINDLRSASGVQVRDQRIRSTATLNDGDHIRIGDHDFVFHLRAEPKPDPRV